MDFLQFLEKLELTLDQIPVSGWESVSRMGGIYMAIDQMRKSISSAQKESEADGGQSDIGTDSSNNS